MNIHRIFLMNRALPLPARRPAESGFSLLEVLVAISLSSIVLIAALSAFDASRRLTRRNLALMNAQQGGTFALQEAAINIRRAGFGLGGTFAIVRNAGAVSGAGTAASPLASWNNYDPAATGTGVTIATAATPAANVYIPVTGTDGITIRYSDTSSPPLHACYQTAANKIELVANSTYMTAGVYPQASLAYELVTRNLTCYGNAAPTSLTPIANSATNNSQITVTAVSGFTHTCNNGAGPVKGDLALLDTACKPVATPAPPALCAELILAAALPCAPGTPAGLQQGSSSVLLYPSRTISFWVSTEDRSGDPAASRPVLVSRLSGLDAVAAGSNPLLTAPTRVVSADIEDLQIVYYRSATVGTADTLAVIGAGPALDILPANTEMPTVRAIRFDLIARTGVTDMMYKNQAYCTAQTQLVPQFSRLRLDDHAAAAAGAADFCNGYRRTIFSQLINLPNMTALPNDSN